MLFNAYTYHIKQLRGDIMKLSKNIALIAMGAGALLMYQKYNKPVMEAVDKTTKKAIKKAKDKLENMMSIKTL